MNIPEYIEDIIGKTSSGQENALERRQLDEWLRESPEHGKWYRELARACDLGRFSLKWDGIAVESAWERVMARYTRARRRVRYSVAAASLVVLAGIYFLYTLVLSPGGDVPVAVIPPGEFKAVLTLADGRQLFLDKKEDARIDDAWTEIHDDHVAGTKTLYHEIMIPAGGEFHLTLPDGTFVYLNAASRLRFPAGFSPGSPREVTLEGEGYFEVERGTSPFIVHARGVDVRVLGTSFNVMAHEEDARVEVTLVQGEVSALAGGEEWRLLPSRQLVMNRETGECTVRQVSRVEAYVNWKNGVLDFDAMPLEELSARLGRWYNVVFFFPDDRLKELLFTGSVKKYENIDYILDLIGATTDVTFKIDGREITVNKK
ncbi:MAG: DUF4974 domain-containing protein [Odoribacteraceae bacterium]|jgi:ferric-dicitrate binding protein FerR (iron transport regulator)|nr:DUF4974 domain-containing protein [Odoribacteraceae bacterium]